MKILFIGSNPSVRAGSNEAFTLDTVSGRILRTWLAGIEGEFFFDNITPEKTDKNRPLSKSEIAEARCGLAERIERLQPDRIVALGMSASHVLKKIGRDFLEMPHPSGLNRRLNDKQYVASKIEELKKYCQEG